MKLTLIDMRLFNLQILRQQIFKFPQSFPRNDGLWMLKINNFLQIRQSSPIIDVIILIRIIFLQGDVIHNKFPLDQGKGLWSDGIIVLILLCSLEVFLETILFIHLYLILSKNIIVDCDFILGNLIKDFIIWLNRLKKIKIIYFCAASSYMPVWMAWWLRVVLHFFIWIYLEGDGRAIFHASSAVFCF